MLKPAGVRRSRALPNNLVRSECASGSPPIPIFIESDLFGDVDDVGALATAVRLQRDGLCTLVGVGINTPSKWGPRAAHAILRSFDNPAAVGQCTGEPTTNQFNPDYARLIGSAESSPVDFMYAPDLLTEVLTSPGPPVTIVSIGFFTNLLKLIESPSGVSLVRSRVRRCVVMGGLFPSGEEYNVSSFPNETRRCLETWPTAIDFVGAEVANDVITGKSFGLLPDDNLLRVAYEAYCGPGVGRPSWDPLTVYLAVCPSSALVSWSAPGRVVMKGERCEWIATPNGTHRYARRMTSTEPLESLLDELMMFDAL